MSHKSYAIMCPSCAWVKSCLVNEEYKYVFKCNVCNKSSKLVKEKTPGISLRSRGPYGNALITAAVVREWNKVLREEKSNNG